VDDYDYFGNTPLINAIYEGNIDEVKSLLKRKANPNIFNAKGNNPLEIATSTGTWKSSFFSSRTGPRPIPGSRYSTPNQRS
jgi:ankyrin repeat protein